MMIFTDKAFDISDDNDAFDSKIGTTIL